jgi:hypothetical protein
MKLLGAISMDFDVTDQLLIRFSAFVRYWEKSGSTMRLYISYSEISSEEGSIVQHSHRVWNPHEISQAH